MVTLNQLNKGLRTGKKRKLKVPALERCPQKKGVCIKILRMEPKKPNSAKRRIAKVRLSNGKNIVAYLPGERGLTIQAHSTVLVRGGRVKDLPGVKYKLIRNKYELASVLFRSSARSKYGVKNWDRVMKNRKTRHKAKFSNRI
jgi:small subunit ribosomal protein S12